MSSTSTPADGGSVGAALCCLIAVAAPVIAIVVVVLSKPSGGRRGQAQAALAWQNLMAAAAAHPGAYLCYVERVYQRAHRGTKAVIVWAGTGYRQDTWFWHYGPLPGAALLVQGRAGYGPHNHNPAVIYVDVGGVLAGAPPGAQQAWLRAQQSPTPR